MTDTPSLQEQVEEARRTLRISIFGRTPFHVLHEDRVSRRIDEFESAVVARERAASSDLQALREVLEGEIRWWELTGMRAAGKDDAFPLSTTDVAERVARLRALLSQERGEG